MLAIEVISGGVNEGGVNSFLGGICCNCDFTSDEDKESKE